MSGWTCPCCGSTDHDDVFWPDELHFDTKRLVGRLCRVCLRVYWIWHEGVPCASA